MNIQLLNPYVRFARAKEDSILQGILQAVDHRIFYCHSGKGQVEAAGRLYPFTTGTIIYITFLMKKYRFFLAVTSISTRNILT